MEAVDPGIHALVTLADGALEQAREKLGLNDPRLRPAVRTSWDGLERMLIDG